MQLLELTKGRQYDSCVCLTQKDKQKNTPGVDLGGDGWVGGGQDTPPPWKLNLLNSHDKITKNN